MAGGRETSWRVHGAMAGWGARRRAWETLWVPGRGQDPNQAAATDGRRREERPVWAGDDRERSDTRGTSAHRAWMGDPALLGIWPTHTCACEQDMCPVRCVREYERSCAQRRVRRLVSHTCTTLE